MKPGWKASLIQDRPLPVLVHMYRRRAGEYRSMLRQGVTGQARIRAIDDLGCVYLCLDRYRHAKPLALALEVENQAWMGMDEAGGDEARRARLRNLLTNINEQVRRFLAVDWRNLTADRREELMVLVRTMRELAE